MKKYIIIANYTYFTPYCDVEGINNSTFSIPCIPKVNNFNENLFILLTTLTNRNKMEFFFKSIKFIVR